MAKKRKTNQTKISRGRQSRTALPGESNGNNLLTELDVIYLRKQTYYHGFYMHNAHKFNVNIETIRAAYVGRSWPHLNIVYPPTR